MPFCFQKYPFNTVYRHGQFHTAKTFSVPICWSNKKVVCFEMFVIDDLPTPVILGSNHSIKINALVDITSLNANFQHLRMNYSVDFFAKVLKPPD